MSQEKKDGLQPELEKNERQKTFHGLGIIIENEFEEILMGTRNTPSGPGLLAIPGGIVEVGDNGDFRGVGIRETMEEFGLDISGNPIVLVSADTSDIAKRGWMNYGLHTNIQGRPTTKPNPREFLDSNWYPKSVVEDLIREPGKVFEPSRISLLCFLKNEVLYPFTREERSQG